MIKNRKNYFWACLAILLLLVIVGLVVLLSKNHSKRSASQRTVFVGKKPDPKLCEHPDGIDLSHHNIAYDWSKVDAKFVYVRATMGKDIKDSRYDIHRKAAIRHEIPVGAYHFLTAKTSAKEQFANFASVVKRNHIQLRPMLDVEESDYWNAQKGFSDDDAHDFIREWCDSCKEKYGIAPIIYTTEKLYQRYKMNSGFSDCIWWVANYNNIPNYQKKCIIPFTLHQYSNEKNVEGFYGFVDCNRFMEGKSVYDLYMNVKQ